MSGQAPAGFPEFALLVPCAEKGHIHLTVLRQDMIQCSQFLYVLNGIVVLIIRFIVDMGDPINADMLRHFLLH